MTVAQIISKQREELKRAHNARFIVGKTEYRLLYKGGIGEVFELDFRPVGTEQFRFFDSFSASNIHTTSDVIDLAKKNIKNLN